MKSLKEAFITGKGRCNFTNAGTFKEDIFNSIKLPIKVHVQEARGFLTTSWDLTARIKFTRLSEVNRYPESDHSSDVIGALQVQMKKLYKISLSHRL